MQKLRAIGTPDDVLRELHRQQSGEQEQILDVNSLMALDQINEENSDMIVDERDLKRLEARQKKELNSGLCKRCRSLRFQNRPIDED